MSPTQMLLPGVLAPAVLAGVLLFLAWQPWRSDVVGEDGGRRPDGRWIGGLAVGGAFFLGYALMFELPPRPFGESALPVLDRLAWISLGLGVVLLLERPLGRAAPLVRVACAAGVLYAVLHAFRKQDDLALLGGLLAGLVVLGAGTQLLALRAPGASLPLALLVAGSGAAVVCGLSISGKIGNLQGVLCAALGAAWVLGLWRSRVTLAGPALTAWVLLYAGLLLCAYSYELPLLDSLLLAAAPLAAWLAELPPIRRRPAWQAAALRALLVALPTAVAVFRAVQAYEPDPYGY